MDCFDAGKIDQLAASAFISFIAYYMCFVLSLYVVFNAALAVFCSFPVVAGTWAITTEAVLSDLLNLKWNDFQNRNL